MERSKRIIDFNDRLFKKTMRENSELKKRLREILDTVRHNEKIKDHFDQLERIILESRTMTDMVKSLVSEIKKRFSLDHVTLSLILPKEEIPLIESLNHRINKLKNLVFVEPDKLISVLPPPFKPLLGDNLKEPCKLFFRGRGVKEIRSKAIIPMLLRGELIGTLNLGSKDQNRYKPQQGTEFLERLTGKIALAIDNIITHQKLMEISITDQLTGLFNRGYFETILSRELQSARRYGTPLSCIIADLDGFKEINDRHGHPSGDQVLIHIAGLLKGNCRGHDIISRYGGDEFIILLPQTHLESARKVAEKFREAIANTPYKISEKTINLSLSLGLASFPQTAISEPKDLIEIADRLLYRSKDRGGNQVFCP